MKLSESDIRKLTLQAMEQLGVNATPDKVREVVKESVREMEEKNIISPTESEISGRVILTSFGMNHSGIVAGITEALSKSECDIQDISQKIMGDYYTMIMMIDITNSKQDLNQLQEEFKKISEQLKVKIYLQHEDVFNFMHRI